jgi:hypothetical protein
LRNSLPDLSAIDAHVVFLGRELAMVASQVNAIAPDLTHITFHFPRVAGFDVLAQVPTIGGEVSCVRPDLVLATHHVAMIAT